MYLSWSKSNLNSKAKAKSLNVRPIKPHIHANLKFVCTICVHFYVSVVCEGVLIFLSIIVSDKTFPPTLIFILFFYFLLFNFDVIFLSYWLKACGILNEIGNRKWWSFIWSNTVPYLSCQARYHCIVSSPYFYLSLGWWHEMYET